MTQLEHKISSETDTLRPLLIRHSNLICFSSSNNISMANCYPWKHQNVIVRSPRPRSVSSNPNNRCKMKSVSFGDRGVAVVFVTRVYNKALIEVLPFDLISAALSRSLGRVFLPMAKCFLITTWMSFWKCFMMKKRSMDRKCKLYVNCCCICIKRIHQHQHTNVQA